MSENKVPIELSVVIPAYNEEEIIEKTVHSLYKGLKSISDNFEIILVDNCSTDNTRNKIDSLANLKSEIIGIASPDFPGYGVAVRAGLKVAVGEFVIITMADGSDDIENLKEYWIKIKSGYDCVFGTRFVKSTKVTNYPYFKMVINRFGNKLLSKIFKVEYDDFTNGFKCYKKSVIEGMQPLISQSFNLTVEMTIKALIQQPRFFVVPTNWTDREKGVSKFSVLKESYLYTLTIIYCLLQKKLKGQDLN